MKKSKWTPDAIERIKRTVSTKPNSDTVKTKFIKRIKKSNGN